MTTFNGIRITSDGNIHFRPEWFATPGSFVVDDVGSYITFYGIDQDMVLVSKEKLRALAGGYAEMWEERKSSLPIDPDNPGAAWNTLEARRLNWRRLREEFEQKEAARLRKRLSAALQALRSVEWHGVAEWCPECRNLRRDGHRVGCQLKAALDDREVYAE